MLFYFLILLNFVFHFKQETTYELQPQIRILNSHTREDINCLAKNIYFEARGEGIEGMLAVARVTLNRVQDYRFPKTICKVVYQDNQFSWTKHRQINPKLNGYIEIAEQAIEEHNILEKDPTEGALWYHSGLILRRPPQYTKSLKFIKSIGGHLFYK